MNCQMTEDTVVKSRIFYEHILLWKLLYAAAQELYEIL